jgi:hypothetical protein
LTRALHALRLSGVLALVFLFSQVFLPAFAATTYTMTLQTDASSYSGLQPIQISGVISPAPGPSTGVIVTVTNSAGAIADINEVFPNAATGSFNDTSVPGGNAAWTSGTFSVNATWAGDDGATVSMVVTFTYSPTAGSTLTTTSTTTTSTTTSSATAVSRPDVTSTTSSTSTSTTVTTSTTPEFPSSALAIVALLGMAVVAVVSRKASVRPPGKSDD